MKADLFCRVKVKTHLETDSENINTIIIIIMD